jgi:hypothetical protein
MEVKQTLSIRELIAGRKLLWWLIYLIIPALTSLGSGQILAITLRSQLQG